MAAERPAIDSRLQTIIQNPETDEETKRMNEMMTKMINDQIIKIPNDSTFRQWATNLFTEEIVRHSRVMNERIDAIPKPSNEGPRPFDDKRSEKVFVPEFSGKGDTDGFEQFSEHLKNWAQALYRKGIKTLNAYEDLNRTQQEVQKELIDPNVAEFGERLYEKLLSATRLEALTFVRNPDRDGIKSWRRLVEEYDPREQVDESLAYASLVQPEPAESQSDARMKLAQWIIELGRYTVKYGDHAVTEQARILALKTLVPAQILGNKFKGEKILDHNKYIESIRRYLNDRTIDERATDMKIGPKKKVTEKKSPLNSIECDEEAKEIIKNEVFSLMKGGKGQGKHKGQPWNKGWQTIGGKGKGPGGANWGDSYGKGWYGGQCAQPWMPGNNMETKGWGKGAQTQQGNPPYGKGQRKGDKGGGKGQKACHYCNEIGHFKRECPWRKGGINELGDDESSYDYYDDHQYQDEQEHHDHPHDADNLACVLDARNANTISRPPGLPKSVIRTSNMFQELEEEREHQQKIFPAPEEPVFDEYAKAFDFCSRPRGSAWGRTKGADPKPLGVSTDRPPQPKSPKGRWAKDAKNQHNKNQLAYLDDMDRTLTGMICEVNNPTNKSAQWELVEAAVDSAAVDSVAPVKALPHIATEPSPRSKSGRHYIAANDAEIKNHGQRKVHFTTDNGLDKNIMFQTADVGRWLVSVDRLNDSGCKVILEKEQPRIVTKAGEVIKLIKKGGVYILRMWVRLPEKSKIKGPFTGQERR